MSAIIKLNDAKDIIEHLLNKMIQKITINYDFCRIHIVLKDGIEIFIVYNNYDEYSYSVLFSKLELDRCRFDNRDNLCEVSSRPHHFHPRKKKSAILSKMVGNPKIDMPYLCDLLKSGELSR